MDQAQSLCHRCGSRLTPGTGNLFIVNIEAFADPTPAPITEQDLESDVRGKIDHLLKQVARRSEQELLDDVYRRLTLHLCGSCFRHWIEDPAS